MLPLSLVESSEFRELLTHVEPQYKVPCRATDVARLERQKAEKAKKLSEETETAPAVHITTDIWSSVANDAESGRHCLIHHRRLGTTRMDSY